MVCKRIQKQWYYHHTGFVFIDETLHNFYNLYNSNLKVYMKDKPGNYQLLFHVLAGASQVIPYVTPPINIPEKTEIYLTLL